MSRTAKFPIANNFLSYFINIITRFLRENMKMSNKNAIWNRGRNSISQINTGVFILAKHEI